MVNKTLIYFAPSGLNASLGVSKKIDSTLKSARNIGLNAESFLYTPNIGGRASFIKKLILTDADYIFIRFDDLVLPFLFAPLVFLRLAGKKIVIDIPTPRQTFLREIESTNRSNLYKNTRKTITKYFGSWFLYPANIVIQYADESWWFEIGIKNKTLKMGNGALINNNTPLIKSIWPSDELKLIGVAQLASWHGYDRLINALALIKNYDLDYKVSFTIVGDGEERRKLEVLVEKLELQDVVLFKGTLDGEDLNTIFEDKHIGVGSLGLYRKGLSEASDLKTREYMSRGLTVLAAGLDIDIDPDSPFKLSASNFEEISSIVEILISFKNKNLSDPRIIRQFAEENLSLESKLSFIINNF